jgi:transcriptional regulator with XRE-family HTH domain
MPLVTLDWQRISVTKTEKTFTATRLLGATVGVRLDPLGANRTATARVSLFQNPKIQSGARLHAPSEPMLEYPPRGLAVVQLNGGQRLRALRETLGYRMRDVELASNQIAQRFRSEEFAIPPSRLSDIETKGIIPSIFRLYSFAAIYRREYRELLSFYGLELNGISADINFGHPQKSHVSEALANVEQVRIPTRLDPGFSLQKTTDLRRAIEQWGTVPMAYLELLSDDRYTYGYIGSEDFTMYPILPPGSFVQVDEGRSKVGDGTWRSEYERPIYFVEMRDGYTCCWCSIKRDSIVLQPHPLSPVPVRVLKYPQEAEVLGQVIGIAMRLGDWHYPGFQPTPKVRSALTADATGLPGKEA